MKKPNQTKHFTLWEKTKHEWKEANPPDFDGYWYCIVGGCALTDGTSDNLGGTYLTLDHDNSRSRSPEMRYDLTNLNPMCGKHNRRKASRSLQEYLATKPDKRCSN